MSGIKHQVGDECPSCNSKLLMAHQTLYEWFRDHVKPNFKNAHISWSYRDEASQEQAFQDGKTKLHYPLSAHNQTPAKALDLFQIDDLGKAIWDPYFFSSINEMNKKIGIDLVWGAQFRALGDYDHFQIAE